jgi:hypothetical protein
MEDEDRKQDTIELLKKGSRMEREAFVEWVVEKGMVKEFFSGDFPDDLNEWLGGQAPVVAGNFWDCLPRPELGLRAPVETQQKTNVVSLVEYKNTGRNEPCPCGSGKKFKYCCLSGVESGELPGASPAGDDLKFDPDVLGYNLVTEMDDEELIELSRRDDLGRVNLVMKTLIKRGFEEEALEGSFRYLPGLKTWTPEETMRVQIYLYILLQSEDHEAFRKCLIKYGEDDVSHHLLAMSAVGALSDFMLDEENRDQVELDVYSEMDEHPVTAVALKAMQVVKALKVQEFETAHKRARAGLETVKQTRWPSLKSGVDSPETPPFSRWFFEAVKKSPQTVEQILSEQFDMSRFRPDDIMVECLLGEVIPSPGEFQYNLESFYNEEEGVREWTFTDPPFFDQTIMSRMDEEEWTTETLELALEDNPTDLGIMLRLAEELYLKQAFILATMLLNRGSELVESSLPEDFEPGKDRIPWGYLENRPYLRLRSFLVDLARQFGKMEDAFGLTLELLGLNPADNQGLRGKAIHFAIALGEPEHALQIADDYPDDMLVETTYGRALAQFIVGNEIQATKALKTAKKSNPHVANYLLHPELEPPAVEPAPGIISESPEEAYLYVLDWGRLWSNIPGATRWLKQNSV